jgi:hypothetical protein
VRPTLTVEPPNARLRGPTVICLMVGSAIVYLGIIIVVAGLVCCVKPVRLIGVATRKRASIVVAAGACIAVAGLVLPVSESHITHKQTRLDEFAPAWQFDERHALAIAAPPDRVFEAIKRVKADEITFFRLLTWIRRGGRPTPPGVLNPGVDKPLLDLVTETSFVWLADEPPHELVVGTVIAAPRGTRGRLTPEVFKKTLPPGFVLATMNFVVAPDGRGGSNVVTETRVFANSPGVTRTFAAYWRVIYPGSAIIRRMWLRAIERRATA